jgi:hypothetical protein
MIAAIAKRSYEEALPTRVLASGTSKQSIESTAARNSHDVYSTVLDVQCA